MSKQKKHPKPTGPVPSQAHVQTQLLGEIHTLIQYARQRADYDKGWSAKQLRHCLRFVEIFSQEQKVSALWRQLSWSHLRLLRHQEGTLTGVNINLCYTQTRQTVFSELQNFLPRLSMASG